MKKIFFLFTLFYFASLFCKEPGSFGFAQKPEQAHIDSLLIKLSTAKEDTTKINVYAAILNSYAYFKPNDGLQYTTPALQLAEKTGWKKGIAKIKTAAGRVHWRIGNFEVALKNHLDALDIYTEAGNKELTALTLSFIGQDYADWGKYPDALNYFSKALVMYKIMGNKSEMARLYTLFGWVYDNQGNYVEASKVNYAALKMYEEVNDKFGIGLAESNLAYDYENLGNYDEALKYYTQSMKGLIESGERINEAACYADIGRIYKFKGKYSKALLNYLTSLKVSTEISDNFSIAVAHYGMGNVYQEQGYHSEALNNFKLAEKEFKSVANKQKLADVYADMGISFTNIKKYDSAHASLNNALALAKELNSNTTYSKFYQASQLFDSATGNWKNAYWNYKQFIFFNNTVLNKESIKQIAASQMQYDVEKKEAIVRIEQDKKNAIARKELEKQRLIRNGFMIGVLLVLIIALVIYRSYSKQRVLNKKLAETNHTLKETQQQLVESERMAAFGVMASRVAHEIQNPLNFVNNFSDLSIVLVQEVLEGKTEEEKNEAAKTLTYNLEKINEHGKRAENIVNQLQERIKAGTAHEFFEENKNSHVKK